jgi:hypothetical protein
MGRSGGLAIAVLAVCAIGAACVDRLPDQDRRITVTPAVEKLTAEDLWKDFQADAETARRRYWGKAIEVSGKVTRADADDRPSPYLFFAQAEPYGVRANLLDDEAAVIIAEAQSGARIRLKCFCEGLDGNVVLKSCIRAQ